MRNLCPRVERASRRNPGFPRARYPCVCSAPVDSMASTRAPKIATLRRIRWDERPETHRSVFGPRKREKTAILAVGDKSSPDGALRIAPLRAWKRTHETRIHGIPWILWISWIFSGKRAFARVCAVCGSWIFCGFRGYFVDFAGERPETHRSVFGPRKREKKAHANHRQGISGNPYCQRSELNRSSDW